MKRQSRGPKSGKNSGKKSGGRFERSDRPSRKYSDEPRKERSGAERSSRDDNGKPDRKSSGRNERSDRKPYEKRENTDRPKYDRSNRGERSGGRNERNERSDRPENKSSRDDKRSSYGDRSDRKPYERKERSDRPKYDRSNRNERSERSDRPESRAGRDDKRSSYGDRSDRKPYERKERSDRPKYDRNSRNDRSERSDRPERKAGRDDKGSSYSDRSDRKPYERKERSDRPKYDRSNRNERSERSDRPERRSSRESSSGERPERKPYERKERSEGSGFGDKKIRSRSDDETGKRISRPRTRKSNETEENDNKPYLKKNFREDDQFSFSKYKKEKKNLARSAEDYNKMVNRSAKKKDVSKADDGSIRLNKYIANAGVCSRREADELIQTGVIKVNGQIVTELGTKVLPADKVQYGDQTLTQEKMVYVLLNKPKDYITTTDDPDKRKTVMELVKNASKERIYPVGRLDRNTTGILLFTNDGELAKKLTHPKYNVKKIYHVMTDQNVSVEDIQKMREGFELEDGYIKTDDVQFVGDASNKRDIGVEIHSGRNRIVRRMFEHLGYNVVKLDRVMFAGLTKKDLPRGKWRFLTNAEVNFLKNL